MWNGKNVSIILPAYNEEKGIREAVESFQAQEAVDEILVVDNNSTDRTAEIVQSTGARLVRETRQGYGHALHRGLAAARGDLLVLCEPDGTFLASDLIKLLAYSDDFQMVMGTRTTSALIWEGANMGWFLRMGNYAVAKLLEFLYNAPYLSDCGCTFRLIHRVTFEHLQPLLTVGASHFLPDMVIAALKTRTRIVEIPLNYRPRVGESKITGNLKGVFRTGTRMVLLILGKRFSTPLRSRHSNVEAP